jgi:hypothetical protein
VTDVTEMSDAVALAVVDQMVAFSSDCARCPLFMGMILVS